MYSKFRSIDPEKQERILNAAMKEFADKGYSQASTNEITKAASISKGLLFHYFDNKKSLFLYLYNYCIDISLKEMYEQLDLEQTDFFIKMKQLLAVKMEIMKRHPAFFNFLETAYTETSSDMKDDLDQINTDLLNSSMHRLFANIDTSKFRAGIDTAKAIQLVLWSLEGFGQHLLRTANLTGDKLDYDTAFAEANEYIEILKISFYN